MKNLITLIFILASINVVAQTLSQKDQIASAVLAATEAQRANATVLGYTSGKLMVLKKGSNELICLADDPAKEGFSVACYHKDLDPMMARGRALRAQGKNRGEVDKIRGEEAASGKLKLPSYASTLHILSGLSAYYDADKNEIIEATLRYVVYIPYATQESTGLPLAPEMVGGPWLMFPGSYRAHIMISPVN